MVVALHAVARKMRVSEQIKHILVKFRRKANPHVDRFSQQQLDMI